MSSEHAPRIEPQPEQKETIEDFQMEVGTRIYGNVVKHTPEGKPYRHRQDINDIIYSEKAPGGGVIETRTKNEKGEEKLRTITFAALLEKQNQFEMYPSLNPTTLFKGDVVESMSGTKRIVKSVSRSRDYEGGGIVHLVKENDPNDEGISKTFAELKREEDNIARFIPKAEREDLSDPIPGLARHLVVIEQINEELDRLPGTQEGRDRKKYLQQMLAKHQKEIAILEKTKGKKAKKPGGPTSRNQPSV